jgi:hypothetical protein
LLNIITFVAFLACGEVFKNSKQNKSFRFFTTNSKLM